MYESHQCWLYFAKGNWLNIILFGENNILLTMVSKKIVFCNKYENPNGMPRSEIHNGHFGFAAAESEVPIITR